ncbi:MAG TPA: MBL fold metallo-hydrolase [Gaiellaceae bacterium]|nr:MBL fold metallo-hydrolase [Gaiellaceae bacterium]
MRSLDDVRPLHLVDVQAYGKRLPVFAWLVDGRILVDTGMVDSTPELDEEWGIELRPWPELPEIDAVINTHLHFDHCGGNRRFAGVPTYVQRAELAAVSEPDYLVEWVRFDGADYRELDGDGELFGGISVLFTPGHSAGHQCVVVATEEGPVVLGGDVTYSMGELIAGGQPNFDRIHALRPRRVYLAHSARPWDPA